MANITGQNHIDSLLAGSSYRWNSGAAYGTAVTLSYSFMESVPSYATSADAIGFAAMSETARDATRRALAMWSDVANISFVEISDSGDGGVLRFGTNSQMGSAAYAYYPASSGWGGDVYLNKNSVTNQGSFEYGSYGFLTLVHEIGHALGLKHSGDYDAGGASNDGPYLPTSEDNYDYTVMSYNMGSGLYPATIMLYDIAAIQYLYGANTSTRTGNDTYRASTSYSQAIWDAGGYDVIEASGLTVAVTIDLNEGGFSSIGATNNLVIAFDAVIEGAGGGSGNDRLIGNAAANLLDGREGDDTLVGGEGDSLYGGTGSDLVELTGGAVSAGDIESVLGSSNADSVTLLSFGNTLTISAVESVVGSGGSDFIILGTSSVVNVSGVDLLLGSSGNDTVLLSGSGNTMIVAAVETFAGSGGSDFLYLGNRGNTVALSGVEIVLGGTARDEVTLNSGNDSVIVAAVEALDGGAGNDLLILGNRGNTMTVSGVETIVGGTSGDFVTLGSAGGTVAMSGVEILLGGAGSDTVSFNDGGGTVIAAALEVVAGNGMDSLILGHRGNTTVISGVDAVTLGNGSDHLTLSAGGSTALVLSSLDVGSDAGTPAGYDRINGFEAGSDTLTLAGELLALVDKDGNGQVMTISRSGGTLVAGSDEVAVLTTTVSGTLTADTDFAAFRSALGTLTSGSTATTLVLANNGSDSGLYAVTDNGDGLVAAGEVRLLAVLDGVVLGAGAIA